MAKITSKRKASTSRTSARRINTAFNESAVRRTITAGVRSGTTLRSIQRSINDISSKIPQRDILQYIRTNYSDRTFNRYLSTYGEQQNAQGLGANRLFESTAEGTRVKGFVRAIDMKTNTSVFHTVDLVVPRNTNIVDALQLVRENGFTRLSDSLEVEIQQTGFLL